MIQRRSGRERSSFLNLCSTSFGWRRWFVSLLLWCLVVWTTFVQEQRQQQNGGSGGGSFVVMAQDEQGTEEHADSEQEQHADTEQEHLEPDRAVLFPWFVNILGVVCFYALARYLHVFPYTACMFCLGLCMGVGYTRLQGTSQLAESFQLWNDINGEVVLLVFLPGLLFKDAFSSNVHLMALAFNQCLVFAFPMVLAGTALTALVAYYIFPYNWSFNLSMTLGSILSATDPVAVSALLEEVGAPPRLKCHVSGESLFNDGSAMVFYTIFSALWLYELNIGLGQDIDGGEGVKIFCQMAFGGFAIGVAFGLALCLILYVLNRALNREENVVQIVSTITIAYLTFYVAEPVAHCSGVIAVVFCGFTTKAFGLDMINDVHMMDTFWVLVEHLLNTVLFTLGGFVWGSVIANADERYGYWSGQDWGYLFALYALLTVIRFFLFFSFYPITAHLGLGTNWQETFFQSYGGLRGAVGIALAIQLDDAIFNNTTNDGAREAATKVFGFVGGIAFLTLIINGTLAGPILRKLGLAQDTTLRRRIVQRYEKAYEEKLLDFFVALLMNPVYQRADFAIVHHHIGVFKDVTPEQFHDAVTRVEKEAPAATYQKPKLDKVFAYFNIKETDSSAKGKQKEKDEKTTEIVEQPADVIVSTEEENEEEADVIVSTEKENEEEAVIQSSTDPPASSIASTPEEECQLTIEFRKIYVELLRFAYHKLIENGELDGREGFATYALMEGLDFASDAVESGKPIADWEMTVKICNSWTESVDRYVTKTIRNLTSCSGSKNKRRVIQDAKRMNPENEKTATVARMAAGLIRAHQIATMLFKKEMTCMGAPKVEALVLEESKAQANLAAEVIADRDDLDVIVSQMVCVILFKKAARFVERLCDQGLLKEGEASEFLEEIQEGVLKVYASPKETYEKSDTTDK